MKRYQFIAMWFLVFMAGCSTRIIYPLPNGQSLVYERPTFIGQSFDELDLSYDATDGSFTVEIKKYNGQGGADLVEAATRGAMQGLTAGK